MFCKWLKSRLLSTSIGRYATPCALLVLARRNRGIGKVEGTVAGKVAASYSRRRLFWMLSAIASRPPAATTGDSALSIRNLTDSPGGAALALEGRPPRPCRPPSPPECAADAGTARRPSAGNPR